MKQEVKKSWIVGVVIAAIILIVGFGIRHSNNVRRASEASLPGVNAKMPTYNEMTKSVQDAQREQQQSGN